MHARLWILTCLALPKCCGTFCLICTCECACRQHAAKQRAAATMHFQNKALAVGRSSQDAHAAKTVSEAGQAEAAELAQAWVQRILAAIRPLECLCIDPAEKPEKAASEESDDTSDTSGTLSEHNEVAHQASHRAAQERYAHKKSEQLPVPDIGVQSSSKPLALPTGASGEHDRQQETLQKVRH